LKASFFVKKPPSSKKETYLIYDVISLRLAIFETLFKLILYDQKSYMGKLNSVFCLLLLISVGCSTSSSEIGTVAIIPKPHKQTIGDGFFSINSRTNILVENKEQAKIVRLIFSAFKEKCGWMPKVLIGEGNGDIVCATDKSLKDECYVLNVSETNISVKANSGAGFFYALQSLQQLMPVSFFSKTKTEIDKWLIPAVQIEDEPVFGWRGYMLDVSRHFFEPEKIKEVLDFMATLKLNRFHWHLADDQGWRVEIKSYPKLTEVGAWRVDYNNQDETKSDWWGRPVQKEGEKATYGGYYTQAEIKDIIAYAKERFIEVIPEIDMPGHAQATIAAYPEIGCVNAAPFVATGGVYQNNTYNPGKEETFEFAEKMLNEIMDLFPFQYIHIGGDECNKNQWKIDPYAQQRMKDEGLANEEELQSYFINRIEKIINARDRIMIGWDEILEGGLAPNAVVMSWRGEEGGITSVKAGHEAIMTPNKYCYLDLKQGHDDLEPNLGYSQSLLSAAYNYQVIPESLTEEEGKLIKGIQGNLWTESISDWSKLTYMTFPRIYAIAENAWTSQDAKNWDDFSNRLFTQFEKLDTLGVRYAVSAFSPWIDHKGNTEGIEVSLKTEVNDLDIYYSLDGSEPSVEDTLYNQPFTITKSAQLKARAFKGTRPAGYISTMDFPIHLAANQKVIDENGKLHPELTDLSYGKLHVSDKNWQKFRNDFSASIIFDKPTTVKEVSFNSLRFTISGIYPPKKIEVWGSENGDDFLLLGQIDQLGESLEQGRNKVNTKVTFAPSTISVLKVKAFGHRPLREGHHRAGQNSIIVIDEIVVF
jgi:hexosaminidase